MPNHVTNRVLMVGPNDDLARFKGQCVRWEEEVDPDTKNVSRKLVFDFNALIPMPPALQETTSDSYGSLGALVYHGIIGSNAVLSRTVPEAIKRVLEYPWVKEAGVTTPEELRVFLETKDPKYREQGDCYKANLEQYGATTWYDWSLEHWGTKWNAYELAILQDVHGKFEFAFDTAWSPPEPIFQAMTEQFPSLSFEVSSIDEGDNFACVGNYYQGEGSLGDAPTGPTRRKVFQSSVF